MPDNVVATDKKINNSLVWKLAFLQVRRIVAICLQIDFWLVILVMIGCVYWGELQGLMAYRQQQAIVAHLEDNAAFLPNNTSYDIVKAPQGVHVSNLQFNGKHLVAPAAFRSLRYASSPLHKDFPSEYNTPLNLFVGKAPTYSVFVPVETGQYLQVSTDLGHAISVFVAFLSVLLLVETCFVLTNLWKSQRDIIRILRPIYDLTATTELINAAVDLEVPLSGTIDALNNINEKHLDRRIAIGDERSELQGLAFAINNMLDRLDASYQAQLRFVSDASHELRTPISIIQGYAGLLERWGKDDPATLDEAISAIKSESISMQKLVEQLLFLARSDNQTLRMKKGDFSLSQLMEEVVKETLLINNTHHIVSDIAPAIYINGDCQLIKQSVRVLVDNSIKYTPANGQISIALTRIGNDNDVVIRVTDTGMGMSDEEVGHAFERFWRADEARNRKTGGTGLGLAIAKRIVDSHDGYMQILSREGLGTRCSIVLPIITIVPILIEEETPAVFPRTTATLQTVEEVLSQFDEMFPSETVPFLSLDADETPDELPVCAPQSNADNNSSMQE